MPGSTPATSQLDWLISTPAITVLSWSKATRDLLKSYGWGIRALHQLDAATMVPSPRRLPHTISPLEGGGFEPSVPRKGARARADRSDDRSLSDIAASLDCARIQRNRGGMATPRQSAQSAPERSHLPRGPRIATPAV